MWSDRERVERRLHAFIADFLDSHDDEEAELDLGVVGLVVELKERQSPEDIHRLLDERQRPDVEYTPAAEWTQYVLYRCTDSRDWVASGLFRRATRIADGEYDDDDEPGDGS